MMIDTHALLAHGIKPSITRLKIYSYLLNSKHPSVDDIYQSLKDELPTLSKTTVYNVLNLFVDKKIVSTLAFDQKELKYEINHHEHAHFQCVKCGDIIDLPYIEIDYKSLQIHGNKPLEHELIIKGICINCPQ